MISGFTVRRFNFNLMNAILFQNPLLLNCRQLVMEIYEYVSQWHVTKGWVITSKLWICWWWLLIPWCSLWNHWYYKSLINWAWLNICILQVAASTEQPLIIAISHPHLPASPSPPPLNIHLQRTSNQRLGWSTFWFLCTPWKLLLPKVVRSSKKLECSKLVFYFVL